MKIVIAKVKLRFIGTPRRFDKLQLVELLRQTEVCRTNIKVFDKATRAPDSGAYSKRSRENFLRPSRSFVGRSGFHRVWPGRLRPRLRRHRPWTRVPLRRK